MSLSTRNVLTPLKLNKVSSLKEYGPFRFILCFGEDVIRISVISNFSITILKKKTIQYLRFENPIEVSHQMGMHNPYVPIAWKRFECEADSRLNGYLKKARKSKTY